MNECYERHLEGVNDLSALYTLATFLNMPVTRLVVESDPDPTDTFDGEGSRAVRGN